mmetsp:Transcript_30938/g.82147  ORF Transcript_30938/g.82147 Transcript_30938/m.82147 type:complete len:81 (+) Transcript_30938:1528-1770(+)
MAPTLALEGRTSLPLGTLKLRSSIHADLDPEVSAGCVIVTRDRERGGEKTSESTRLPVHPPERELVFRVCQGMACNQGQA